MNNECRCGSGKQHRNAYDGYGIYLCKVCDECENKKLSAYRSDIMDRYDADEPIDSDYSDGSDGYREWN
jgi:hypothetical protein